MSVRLNMDLPRFDGRLDASGGRGQPRQRRLSCV